MKTIKFESHIEKEKLFNAALRINVGEYFKSKKISTKGNAEIIWKTIVMSALYIAPFVCILAIPMSGWLAIFLCIVMGSGMAGVGMCTMHDAVHGSYSKSKWLNKLMSATIYFIGSNITTWKIQHNYLHHTFTNIFSYDEDINTKGLTRLAEHAPLRKYHRYQHIYTFFFYGFMTISKLIGDFSQILEYNKFGLTRLHREIPSTEIAKMIFTKVIYLSVIFGLPLWFTSFSWWEILIGFFVMHMTGGIIMSTVFQMAHVVEGNKQPLPNKNGIIEEEWSVHQLRTTSDFARNNLVLGWFIGGLNFQIEHHLFPNVSHVHYRAIAPIVQKTALEFGFNYNLKPSFGSALASHLRMLKKLGRE